MAIESRSKEWVMQAASKAKLRRKQLGMTQKQLALLAGCHFVFINELEHGKSTLRIDKVLDVLITLGLEPTLPG